MMPDVDGYETIRNIREDSRFGTLPILALTAKAMAGDRERCLEAGVSDYISKPVDTEQLLALMRLSMSTMLRSGVRAAISRAIRPLVAVITSISWFSR
jgi:CheY-like chemotaxis protein